MASHHFFVDGSSVRDDIVELTGEEAHHAARVLRIKAGEPITVADGSGTVLDAIVTDVEDVVRAAVRATRHFDPPKPAVTLCQAAAKGDRLDDVVRMAVEIGIARFIPFLADRSVVRWSDDRRRKARVRFAAIALSAAKQCRSPFLTVVEELSDDPTPLLGGSAVLVLHEQSSTKLRDALPPQAPDRLALVVGPEGGLTTDEVDAITAHDGNVAVTLGERILRTETAGLVATAMVRYAYGTLG